MYLGARGDEDARSHAINEWKVPPENISCGGCGALTPESMGSQCVVVPCLESKGYEYCRVRRGRRGLLREVRANGELPKGLGGGRPGQPKKDTGREGRRVAGRAGEAVELPRVREPLLLGSDQVPEMRGTR